MTSVTHVRPRMGTLLAVTLPAGDRAARWVDVAFDTATECERALSAHDPSADLARLNELAPRGRSARPNHLARSNGRAVMHSPLLAWALRRARMLADRTGGAFDPTVAPVIDAWRRVARRGTMPSARALVRARERVDRRAIRIRGARVSLARAGVTVDLGGIGKGLALDRIATRLRRAGCRDAILNFGESSLVALGPRSWRVLLRHPIGGFAGELTLRDRACSTSGSRGQTMTIRRRVLSHVMDPRTAQPLTRVAQATVVARSAATAEAASTALLVLGPDAMDDLARRLGVDACWIDARGIHTTPGFRLRDVAGARHA